MEFVAELRGIHKKYGQNVGLHPLDLDIVDGSITGIIGPDGAGKTTLLRILSTVMKPTNGTVRIWGLDTQTHYRYLRLRIGYMPGRFSLYPDLTVLENITFFATVFGVELREALRRVDNIYSHLSPFSGRKAAALSGGMKQKLALCCAMVHKPHLLLLDEPTTGVDAVSRREFWDALTLLNSEGVTIVVSTPYMDEASRCSTVTLIQEGRVLKSGPPTELVDSYRGVVLGLKTNFKFETLQKLREYPHVHHVHTFGEWIHYTDRRNLFDPSDITMWLRSHGIEPLSVAFLKPGIEDVFIQMMLEDDHVDTP